MNSVPENVDFSILSVFRGSILRVDFSGLIGYYYMYLMLGVFDM